MFNIFKRKKIDRLFSPVNGRMISLEDVPDQVFSSKLLGDGVAFEFDGDTIYSPCDAQVVMFFETKHAIGLKTENDIEILIHIGMNTVELNGEGFKKLVNVNDKVKKGDALLKIDRDFMDSKKICLTTPMIITSKNKFDTCEFGDVNTESEVIRFE